MAPTDRFVPRFAAEPPQEGRPYGRWAHRLGEEFFAACLRLDTGEDDIGEPGDIEWYPDRTYYGRTYVPATSRTSTDWELYGFVSFLPGGEDDEPSDFVTVADFTSETAERNPEWQIDLCDESIGAWRGEPGKLATITLVWGRPLRTGGVVVTAELADLAVDQCTLVEERFTMIAPDNYRGDFIDVKLWDSRGTEIARESVYEEDDEDEEEEEEETAP
jgi:hypothetical protein